MTAVDRIPHDMPGRMEWLGEVGARILQDAAAYAVELHSEGRPNREVLRLVMARAGSMSDQLMLAVSVAVHTVLAGDDR